MNLTIQIVIETEVGPETVEVGRLERDGACVENLGISLKESKDLLAAIQKKMVEEQISEYLAKQRKCGQCGEWRGHHSMHQITFQTLFGNLKLASPRWNRCGCESSGPKTFSPLVALLTEHVSPERLYLETKWGTLMAFEPSAELLKDTLPIAETISANTVRNHLHRVARRVESELGEEQVSFIEGCPADWGELPRPPAPLTVGIDGGYVRQWDDRRTHFEVIVGKSVPEEGSARRFAFVQTYDEKPNRRVFEVLKGQGMQNNQTVVFLSDGGEDVRDVQRLLNPEAEHYLDWFHITMRITVMKQMARGLPAVTAKTAADGKAVKDVEKELQSLKWNLWHGNVTKALNRIDDLDDELETRASSENRTKLRKTLREFRGYIKINREFIPNYGERYRNQERISTAFVESAVNQVISKRMVKKQGMQWSKEGAHLLLQMRTRVLNGELDQQFRQWYPKFRPQSGASAEAPKVAA